MADTITAVYAAADGTILDAPGLMGMGRTGEENVPLTPEDIIPLPGGADLMLLPDRLAVGQTAEGEALPIEGLAVAAILPAGYTRLFLPAYVREEKAERLPLYGYTAVVVCRDKLCCAAVYTDENDKWDPVHYNTRELAKLVKRTKKELKGNRIVEQVGGCSLNWHCCTAQNLFYRRWECAGRDRGSRHLPSLRRARCDHKFRAGVRGRAESRGRPHSRGHQEDPGKDEERADQHEQQCRMDGRHQDDCRCGA